MTRLVLAVVAVAAALHLAYAISRSTWTSYYVTPRELLARPASVQPVRLAGVVTEAPAEVDPGTLALRFELEDGGFRLPVLHRGSVPGTFGSGRTVILEGVFEGGVFRSHSLLVKCPHRYLPAL